MKKNCIESYAKSIVEAVNKAIDTQQSVDHVEEILYDFANNVEDEVTFKVMDNINKLESILR